MPGIHPLIAAAISAVLVMGGAWWWFGVHRRRRIEQEAGIAALADMKWRDCLGLILQALARDGHIDAPDPHAPVEVGSELLLSKGAQSCLFAYKHGTAYRLGEANVREFAASLQLQGAERGILVTLGSAESMARDLARRQNIELLDAAALWPRVRSFLPEGMATRIRQHAASVTRHGVDIGMVLGLAVGVAVYWASPARIAPAQSAAGTPRAAPEAAGTRAATAASPGGDAASLQANAAADALQAVAALTDAERARRRAAAATGVSGIQQVHSAVWSTQSTLVLALAQSDGDDQNLVAEACRILVQYEELRYSRLQLEPPQGSELPVRWRQCQ